MACNHRGACIVSVTCVVGSYACTMLSSIVAMAPPQKRYIYIFSFKSFLRDDVRLEGQATNHFRSVVMSKRHRLTGVRGDHPMKIGMKKLEQN